MRGEVARVGDPANRDPSHRDALLREGLRQLLTYGYHGTTVDGVLRASGVPKGSFYHHFHTKERFVDAVLEQFGAYDQARLAAWGERDDLPISELLVGYFRELTGEFIDSGFVGVDVAAKLATEVASTTDPLRLRIAAVVSSWRATLEDILDAGQRRGDVRTDMSTQELSAAIHALTEGAFVVAGATRSEDSLESVAHAIAYLTTPH